MFINIGGAFKKGVPWVNVGGTWKKGVASWVNVGGTWRKMTAGIQRVFSDVSDLFPFRAVNVTPSSFSAQDERHFIMTGGYNEVAYTSTKGSGWNRFGLPVANSVHHLCSVYAGAYYIGSSNGDVWRGTGGKDTYSKLVTTPDASAVVALAYTGNAVLALSSTGRALNLTTNATLPTGLNSGGSQGTAMDADGALVVAGFKGGYAAISRNGGNTWQPLPRGLGLYSNPDITSVSVKGNLIMVGMANQYASMSTDGGTTWKPCPRGLTGVSSGTVRSMSVLAVSEDEVYALMSNGMASVTTDKGYSWDVLPRGLNSGMISATSGVLGEAGPTIYAGFNLGYISKGELPNG